MKPARADSAHPATVLIADKSHDTREVVADILNDAGYRCVVTGDGLEAMNAFRHARPELVIIGTRLQVVSSVELLKHVREKDPDAAVIVMSGEWGVEWRVDRPPTPSIRECYELGAFNVLTKPADLYKLLIYAERALERRQLLIERRRRLAGQH